MNEDELRIMKAQMIDLNTRVNKLSFLASIKEFIIRRSFEISFLLIILISQFISCYIIESHLSKKITASSIKNLNAVKKEIKAIK